MSIETLFQSGNIALIIVAVMAIESIILFRFLKHVPGAYAGLAAGAGLALALRAALLQHGTIYIALFLFLSFLFHSVEVWQWLRLAKQQAQ